MMINIIRKWKNKGMASATRKIPADLILKLKRNSINGQACLRNPRLLGFSKNRFYFNEKKNQIIILEVNTIQQFKLLFMEPKG